MSKVWEQILNLGPYMCFSQHNISQIRPLTGKSHRPWSELSLSGCCGGPGSREAGEGGWQPPTTTGEQLPCSHRYSHVVLNQLHNSHLAQTVVVSLPAIYSDFLIVNFVSERVPRVL